jgi:hypothetical protein
VFLFAAAVAATCLALWVHGGRSRSPAGMPTAPGEPEPVAIATPAPVTPPVSVPAVVQVRVADVHGGRARRDGIAVAPGALLAAGEPIEVEPRATLRLLWIVDVGDPGADGEAAPPPEVLVLGPALVEIGEGRTPLLVVRRGEARVTGGRVMIAEAPSGPAGSAGILHVLRAGATAEPRADGVEHRPATPAEDLDASLEIAEAALGRGDRATAEAMVRRVLRGAHDGALVARAQLMLAELLLARGEADEARGLLAPLAFGKDPRRAADAAWLYARSLPSAAERADAWARYLATSPPPEMRALASIERASALVDAGDLRAARAIAAELDAASLSPVAADALRRLRGRLGDR